MNSDTIEQLDSDHTISMRCLLNHFIMFMNNRIYWVITEKMVLGLLRKAVVKYIAYYGLGDYTNDIDVKVFFYHYVDAKKLVNHYKDAQRNILSFMLALRYIIKNYNFTISNTIVKLGVFRSKHY